MIKRTQENKGNQQKIKAVDTECQTMWQHQAVDLTGSHWISLDLRPRLQDTGQGPWGSERVPHQDPELVLGAGAVRRLNMVPPLSPPFSQKPEETEKLEIMITPIVP